MTWKAIRNQNDIVSDALTFITEKLKTLFPFSESEKNCIFLLPDGVYMRVFSMRGDSFNCLGMEYGDSPNALCDDGDLYYPQDYETPDDMLNAMLEEINRPE